MVLSESLQNRDVSCKNYPPVYDGLSVALPLAEERRARTACLIRLNNRRIHVVAVLADGHGVI